MLIVFLFCAMMAAALAEAEAGNDKVPLIIQDALAEAEAGNGKVPLIIQDEVVKCNHRINITPAQGLINKTRPTCPCGWIEYRGRCFVYVPTAMSWIEAERNCQSMNGNLASAKNIEELQLIQRIIFVHTHWNPRTWLGGSDSQQEGVWRWRDGTIFTFTHWCSGEPNNADNQDCLQINLQASRCWDDMWCHAHLPSVCAKSLR